MPLRIEGDQLEQHRIKLERDIANTIPSPPTMSPGSVRDNEDEDVSSVDFPRHNSNPRHSFHSFEHPSHFDSDFYSRHGDEDSVALDPDLGHTISTAAHHASALTLTAGLHGRNYTPGKSRQSNQEFDPDRPLQPMLNVADGLSMLDSTAHTNTKSHKSSKFDKYTFNPIIVDSTVELDRFLKTGFRQPNVSRSGTTPHYLNRSHSQPEPRLQVEDSSTPPKSPLSLSQALGSHFSPKRPRSTPASAQSFQFPKLNDSDNNSVAEPAWSRRSETLTKKQVEKEKENKPLTSAFHGTRTSQSQSKIHFQEPVDADKTPKPRKSGFAPDAVSSVQRPALADKSNRIRERSNVDERSRMRVHLPDVTDLSAAVESPMKGNGGYLAAKVANRRFAADVAAALDGLQSRLDMLERENGVSRRRVKELEYDLEECKADVVRERKRMKARELDQEAEKKGNGETGHRAAQEEEGRYFSAVEEKKTLETFVATMREHVVRLTSEVALHRSLIDGLRQDVDASDEIQAEVQTLNVKVERLGGEVERLKTFVEEGVRERQRFKDVSAASISRQEKSEGAGVPSQTGIDITYVTNPLFQEDERSYESDQMKMEDLQTADQEFPVLPKKNQESLMGSEDEPFQESEEERVENTSRPDGEGLTAPDGETTERFQSYSQRYIDDSELAKVQAEISERRSERSLVSRSGSDGSKVDDEQTENLMAEGLSSPVREPSPVPSVSRFGSLPSRSRPLERERMPRQTSDPLPYGQKYSNTAFPQIRGSRMERLFFAAPEHDAMTCHVCHRRKRRGFELNRRFPSEDNEQYLKAGGRCEGAGRDEKAPAEGQGRKPPQTVLTRVLRELEDDFSHYKAIYLELAEQYAVIDAVSNVAKRNVLADHLREVIDSLEQKGDQIAALYELLHFQDKPVGTSKFRHATFA